MTEYISTILRFLFVVIALTLTFIVLFMVSKVTYPFIIGLLIAMMINPLVQLMERRGKMPRALAVLVALILVIGLIAGLITLLVAEIINGSNYLAKVVPEHFERLVRYFEEFFTAQIIPLYNQLAIMFDKLDTNQKGTIVENIQNAGTNIASTVSGWLRAFLESIPDLFAWLPNAATVIVFSLLAAFFITKDWSRLNGLTRRLIPEKVHESSASVINDLKKALFGFIRAQLTLISITAVIVLIGLLILRVDYAITIALIIGLVDLLPYLGTGAIFVPWIIYAFISGQYTLTIGLSILYAVVVIQRQVMEPKVLSSSIGLDPLATLIALFAGFKVFGFLGLIIGPVLLVIIKTLHEANVFHDLWLFITAKNKELRE
ncbi:sporulation integral membrane protein YtvI [Bacillus marinisedimentorum]|uniref:sporulation integral membrane protein YtvI n=1 Tax=Bacillus marinisedimentorum TaxID=1821260 RepID=UPI001FE1B38F|nr:sporulation integral membrane protein YtvI [Bacillus marinisedimentorum]